MQERIFTIEGDKIKTLVLTYTSMKFSSTSSATLTEFEENWNKKISLANQFEVKYENIKSIVKEENENDIRVKYKNAVGLPSEIDFKFTSNTESDFLFNVLEKEQYFNKSIESLKPFKAVVRYVLGLLLTIAGTVVFYGEALKQEAGEFSDSGRGKARIVRLLVGKIGHVGIIIIGVLICSFLLYKIYSRAKNPPVITKFTKPLA